MAVLTAKARDKLRKSRFALPAKRRYPAVVYKKYPRLKKRK